MNALPRSTNRAQARRHAQVQEIPFVRPNAVNLIARNLRTGSSLTLEKVRNLQRRVRNRAGLLTNAAAALRWSYALMNQPVRCNASRYRE